MDMFASFSFEEVPHIVEACFCTRTVGHPHHLSVRTITWFTVPVISPYMLQFPKCMHLHLLQHVNLTAQLFHGHADPWELLVEDMDLYRGCEDFCDAHGLQEDDAHGDGIERQPAEDGEAIFVPTMSSINLDVGLTTLSGCRTLAIDFIEFCNDESILTNFIFWTESEGDTVDVRHGTFTLTFINVGELINCGEQHAFLRRILCRHRNVIRYLVFFNYEVGEVHLIAFDKCGMEIMTDDLYDFTIEEYANADAGL
nr:hypothetical protein Iba_scaffold1050CG0440 [Ipomoea batatas]